MAHNLVQKQLNKLKIKINAEALRCQCKIQLLSVMRGGAEHFCRTSLGENIKYKRIFLAWTTELSLMDFETQNAVAALPDRFLLWKSSVFRREYGVQERSST